MATSPKIQVMLSSRCNDPFSDKETKTLTDTRRELKRSIEKQQIFGLKPFKVWINEDAEPQDHLVDSWDACLRQVRDCDILIVLYNGNAGWAKTGGDIGICQAEYAEGLKTAPGKVRLVELPICKSSTKPDQAARNERFAEFKKTASGFRGGTVKTLDDLKNEVEKALFDAVLTQTRRGGEADKSSRFDLGAALEWSRLDFVGRKAAMEAELYKALKGRPGTKETDNSLAIQFEKNSVFVSLHAVPAAFSVAAAREMVGRPHLRDHQLASKLAGADGPLHLIACHRSVSESQATNLLGFPDATVISSPFGVYVADNVQKMQFVFLANCRDPIQTRLGVQRFFEWLDQAGESQLLTKRAKARANIIKAIAREQK